MFAYDLFDLPGADAVTHTLEEVTGASHDVDEPVGVHTRQVTRSESTIGEEAHRLLRVLPVAQGDVLARSNDLPNFVRARQNRSTLRVQDLQFRRWQASSD